MSAVTAPGSQAWSEVSVDQLKAQTESALSTGPFGSSIGARFFQATGVPVIRGSNLAADGRTHLIEKDFVFVSESKAAELRRSVVHEGDLIFTCWGTVNQVGLISSRAAHPRYVISNKQMKLTPDPGKADSLFLFYLFSGDELQRQITTQSIGSSVPGFNLGQLRALRFRVPPLPEQVAIAEALSDADAQIEALIQLITKKHAIKQGVMQELLTGRRRLPGFDGEWVTRPISDMADVLKGSGLSKAKVSANGTRPCILYGELFTIYGRVIVSPVSHTDSPEGLASIAGDVLVPGSTTTTGIDLAIASALLAEGVALGGDMIVIRSRGISYDAGFLANVLTYGKRREIAELTQGTTIHHLHGRKLGELELQWPTYSEQTAITAVLSDMDAEINAVQARLAKARELKRGMMQELLTGKTRLI